MITIEANDTEYTGFLSVSAGKSLESLSGTFSFTATSDRGSFFPLNTGDAVKILVDGTVVITGFIDQVSASYSNDSHSINVQGRDKTSDLIDSSLVDAVEVESNSTLKQIVEKVIGLLGAKIDVIDNTVNPETGVSELKPFSAGEIVSSEPAQNAFEFILNYARKRQALLTSNGEGNIVITRSPNLPIDTVLLNEQGNPENNIKTANVTYRDQERFQKYVVISSQSGSSANFLGISSGKELTNKKGEFTDRTITRNRILAIESETQMNSDECADRAKWECNLRKAQAREYTCVVQGHSHLDGVWLPGFITAVSDDFLNVFELESLLCKSVQWNFSLDGGSETELIMTDKEAYSLQVEEENRKVLAEDTEGGTREWG